MLYTEDYNVGDLVRVPPSTPAIIENPVSHSMEDFYVQDIPPTIGIITNISLNPEYGEITIYAGHDFIYIPVINEIPQFIILEKGEC